MDDIKMFQSWIFNHINGYQQMNAGQTFCHPNLALIKNNKKTADRKQDQLQGYRDPRVSGSKGIRDPRSDWKIFTM